jgi:hypothetical protein
MHVVARYGVPTTGRAVVLRAGTAVTSCGRATVIFRPMPDRASVMRYRTTVRATSMRTNDAPSGELTRSRRRGHRGSAVVKRGTQLPVTGGGMFVVTLQRRGLDMMIMFRGELVRSRTRLDTARAVERHAAEVVVDDGPVVHVGDVDTAHVHRRAVVEKGTTAPVTALESNTTIAEAIVHTAVEADMRAPVAGVPGVDATTPTPVAGRPQ